MHTEADAHIVGRALEAAEREQKSHYNITAKPRLPQVGHILFASDVVQLAVEARKMRVVLAARAARCERQTIRTTPQRVKQQDNRGPECIER